MRKRTLCHVMMVALLAVSSCELQRPGDFATENVFALRASKDALYADGRDRVTLTVTLQGDTPDGQTVSMVTDWGRFAGVPIDEGNEQKIAAFAAGREASVDLVADVEVRDATILASLDDFTESMIITVERVYPESVELSTSATRVRADGISPANLTARLRGSGEGEVSSGTRVIFEAKDADNGARVQELDREAVSEAGNVARTPLVSRSPVLVEVVAFVEAVPTARDSVAIEFTEAP